MTAVETLAENNPSRLLHRLTVLIVCLVWPLIWVGGLVTTYDAGMSVPDWPGTYGYNLFLYPYKTWLFGPFDLFIEHGHRLLGAVVGFVAIGIVIAAFWKESRRWVRWLCVALLLMVIAQGALGGVRVGLSDRTLAMVHGCFGPVFFAICGVVAVVTGRRWGQGPNAQLLASSKSILTPTKKLATLAIALVVFSYLQLLLGAMMRHVQPTTSAGHFAGIVSTHILTAFLLWALTGLVWLRLRRCGDLTLSRPGGILIFLVGVQIALGIGTWVVNYGWPSFMTWVPGSQAFLVQAKGFVDSMIVTGHVATGSLILAVSAMLCVRLFNRRWQASQNRPSHDQLVTT
jgi:cytochrome c oxidase assembly protein subunit 15